MLGLEFCYRSSGLIYYLRAIRYWTKFTAERVKGSKKKKKKRKVISGSRLLSSREEEMRLSN